MIEISVPATSANLGPGFDALGLALGLRNKFLVEKASATEVLGCPEEFSGEDNLFVSSARRAASALGLELPPFRLRVEAEVPVARGLGSSATLVVGGVLAAVHLAGATVPVDELLDIAAAIEGHPDNTTPALLGGFTVAIHEGTKSLYSRKALGRDLVFSALVPPFPLETAKARAVLPDRVLFRDAVENLGRAALVAAAFHTSDWGLLSAAMKDRLHESRRAALIPGFGAAVEAAKGAGALAVYLSGAGPTVMAISLATEPDFARRLDGNLALQELRGWLRLTLAADDEGAWVRVGEADPALRRPNPAHLEAR